MDKFVQELDRAIKLYRQEKYVESAEVLVTLDQESASVQAFLGYIARQLGDLPSAVQHFSCAVKLAQQSELASLGLYHSLLESGDELGAIAESRRFNVLREHTDPRF